MDLKWRETRRFLTQYMMVYVCLVVVLFLGLRWYKNKNFSKEKLEIMMTMVSGLRDKTSDPCKYAVLGEPTTAGLDYLKVNIYCTEKSKSLNSMDLRAIKERTVMGAIKELARVNGFEVKLDGSKIFLGSEESNKSWICKNNRASLGNFSDVVYPKTTIDCFRGLSENEIIKFYESI